MSNSPHSRSEHLTEGELVRYLDGEIEAGERSRIAEHLLACSSCRAQLEQIRSAREELEGLLNQAEISPDAARKEAARAAMERALAQSRRRAAPRFRGAWLRAAAVATVLLASTLSISPARAWVAQLWHGAVEQVERLAGVEAPAPAPVELSLSNATIGFVPRGERFLLEVRSTQRSGSLVLGIADGASVTASASGEEEIALLVRQDGMRIENSPNNTADYAIRLPAQLREVRIRVGETEEQVYRIDQLAGSWISVVPLQGDDSTPSPAATDSP